MVMSKLDTNHVVNLDLVKDRVNSIIKFGLADVETSDFYLGLYNNGSRVFDKDYIVTLYIVKPNGTFRNIELKSIAGLKKYYCNLPDTLKNIPGEYVCQAMVFDNLTGEKKISKSKFKYSVSVDLASEMAGIIDEEEQESILTNILNRLLTLENPVEPYATQKHVDECVSTLTEEIDTIKVKDAEQDGRLVNIESKNTEQDERLDSLENKVNGIDEKIVETIEPTLVNHENRLDTLENKDVVHESRMTNIESKNTEQDNRLTNIEEINTTQNNRLDALETKDIAHESRMTDIESKNTEQDGRLDITENRLANIGNDITNTMQPIIDEHTSRLNDIEAIDVAQNTRLDAIEVKNQQQDDRLLDIEKVNKRQDIDLKCLFTEAKNNMMNITEEGNSIYLQNSTTGHVFLDEIEGNTLVNCNKEPDKELILNGNINTSGDNNITLTEGVDGGLVDVALEGNTMVNVCDQKDPVAITKSYTVETGNHVALQGEYDGKCRPVVTGNTLVNCIVDNSISECVITHRNGSTSKLSPFYTLDQIVLKPSTTYTFIGKVNENTSSTGCIVMCDSHSRTVIAPPRNNITTLSKGDRIVFKFTTKDDFTGCDLSLYHQTYDFETNSTISITQMILEGDYTDKPIPDYFEGLQSSFEDKVVTQEMVDAGEELAENLGKYKVDYVISKEDGTVGQTKTFYLNSPLLEGDTIEQQGDNVVHVHRYGKVKLNNLFQGTGQVFDNGVLHFGNNNYLHIQNANNTICDKMITALLNSSVPSTSNAICTAINSNQWRIYVPGLTTLDEYIDWIANSDINIVYELQTPQYEVISTNDTILCDSYVNGHLDVDSVVPIEKVDFLPFEEELTYLYPSTQYAVQFVSDAVSKVDVTLGGAKLLNQDVVVGTNKYTITTPSELVDNKLVISGVGLNIEKVVVTDTDREFMYFEGMKSVGECEGNEIEIVSRNKNLWDTEKVKRQDGRILSYTKNNNIITYTEESVYGIYIPIKAKKGETLRISGVVKNVNNIRIYKSSDYFKGMGLYTANYGGTETEVSPNFVYTFTEDGKYNIRLWCSGIATLTNFLVEMSSTNTAYVEYQSNTQQLTHEPLRGVGEVKDRYALIDGKWYIERNCGVRAYQEGDKDNYKTDLVNTVYPLTTATYEPIGYNPLEVYSGVTYISTNSAIPCNITVKNHGYNCLLKPSTTYTISSNLGLNTVTTPSTLTEDCLRFYDTDTSTVTTMKDVTILEGDWTTKADLIPANFSGMESAFEQEYDAEKGKYKVNVKVANEDKSEENNITFYINEPLRGIGDVKDRVYIKDNKVVVQRNYGIRPYEDGDFGTYPTDKVNTVYPLVEPTYEEVDYIDNKLFIESFKNSTLSYNSNVPVTSKLYYSYSVPLVDKVSQTADISDQQDSMIIDLATQCAVMEIMLM